MLNELLYISAQGAILAALVGGLLLVFGRRLSANARFLLWGIVLLRFLLPITPPSVLSLYGLLGSRIVALTEVPMQEPLAIESMLTRDHSLISENKNLFPTAEPTKLVPAAAASAYETPANSAAERAVATPTTGPNLLRLAATVVQAVWFLGAAFLLLRMGRAWLELQRRRKKWNEMRAGSLWELLEQCRQQLGIRRKVRLFLTRDQLGAASCGVLRPAILLSENIEENFSSDELRLILLHELMHHKRLDPLTHCLAQLARAVHWPNPLAWWAVSRLRNERELAVDERIVRGTGSGIAPLYGGVILKTVRHYALVLPMPNLLGVQSQDQFLERRITMIIQKKKPTFSAMLLGIALVLGLAITGLTDAKPLSRQQTPEQTQDGAILIQGQTVDPDGKPVPKARLYFSLDGISSDESSVVSDAQGKFRYSCPEKDVSQLHVTAISEDENMYSYLRNWEYLKMNGAPGEVKLRLFPQHGKFRAITGTVVDATGRPVEGVAVGGTGEVACSLSTVKTDAEGQFRFLFPENAPLFQVFAVKPGLGFAYVVTEEQYAWEGKTPAEKISNGPFRLVLGEVQTVEVKIVDEKGNPIPGATVSPDIEVGKKQERNMKSVFRPNNLLPSVFFPQTDKDGIVRFNWIPTQDLQNLFFTAKAPKEPVALPDGTSRLFGNPGTKRWDPQEKLVTITLPRGAKVKLNVRKPDGTPAAHYGILTEWETKTNWIMGWIITTDEKGEAEIFANAGDRFDAFASYGSQADNLVFQTIHGFEVGDGSREKELVLMLQPGAKVFGTVYGPDGQPFAWEGNYRLYVKQIGFEHITPQGVTSISSDMVVTGSDSGAGDIKKASFQSTLPPGEFEIKIEPTYERMQKLKPEERLGDEQRIKVTDQKEIKLELHLKPLPPEK